MTFESPDRSRIPALRSLWKEAFGDTDEFLDGFFEYGFSPDRCRCIVKEGAVLSALYWFEGTVEDQRFAYLYAVATAKAARGQGLFSALLQDVKRLLAAEGFDGILLHPADEGLARMYEKFGFSACANVDVRRVRADMWEMPPSDEGGGFAEGEDGGREKVCGITTPPSACSADTSPDKGRLGCRANPSEERLGCGAIREVFAETYAALRRAYLPVGAVLQEGDWLPFLNSQYRFFGGGDFLAAGQIYEGKFYAQEFLGNADCMAPLLCDLGVEEGVFRTVGESTPFVWYLPLTERCVKPQYFAMALD